MTIELKRRNEMVKWADEKLELRRLYEEFNPKREEDVKVLVRSAKTLFGNMVFHIIEEDKMFEGTIWDIDIDVRGKRYVADDYNMLYLDDIGISRGLTKSDLSKLKDLLPDMSFFRFEVETRLCNKDIVLHLFEDSSLEGLTIYVKYPKDEFYGSRRNMEGSLQLKIILELMKRLGMKVSEESIDHLKHERDKLMSEYEVLFDRLTIGE